MKKLLSIILFLICLISAFNISAEVSTFSVDNDINYEYSGIEIDERNGHVVIKLSNLSTNFSDGKSYELKNSLDLEFNDEFDTLNIEKVTNIYHTDWHELSDELYVYIWMKDLESRSNYQALLTGQNQKVLIDVIEYTSDSITMSESKEIKTDLINDELGIFTETFDWGDPSESESIVYKFYTDETGVLWFEVLSNSMYDPTYNFNHNRGYWPEINLVGEYYEEFYIGETYSDPGFTVTDEDDPLTIDDVEITIFNWSTMEEVDSIDTNIEGYYQIQYELYDYFGNGTRQYRNVNVFHNPKIPKKEGSFSEMDVNLSITNAEISNGFLNITYNYTGDIQADYQKQIQFNFSIEGNDTWPWISAEEELNSSTGVVSFNLDRLILSPNVPSISEVSTGVIGVNIWENDYNWQHRGSFQIDEFEYIVTEETSYTVDYGEQGNLTYTLTNDESGSLMVRVENSNNVPDTTYMWDLNHYASGSLSDNYLDINVDKVTINQDLGTIDIEYTQVSDFTELGEIEMNLYTHFQANPKEDQEWNEWIYVSDNGHLLTSGVFSLPLKNAVQSQNMKAVYSEVEDWNSEIVPNENNIGFSVNNYSNDEIDGWEHYGYYSVNAILYSGDFYVISSGVETIAQSPSDSTYTIGSLTYTLRKDENNILKVAVTNSDYDPEAEYDHSIRNDFDWLDHNTFEITDLRIDNNRFEIDYKFNIDETISLDKGSYNLNVYTESEECYDVDCTSISLWGYSYLGEVSDISTTLETTSGTILLEMTESNITSWYSYNIEAIKDKIAEIKVDLSYWNDLTYDYGYASFKPELTSNLLTTPLSYSLNPYEDDERSIVFTWQKNSDELLELSWHNEFYDLEAPLKVPTPEEINIKNIKLTEKFYSNCDDYETQEEDWSYFTILVEMEERISGGLRINTDHEDWSSWVGYAEGKYGEINYYSLFYGEQSIQDEYVYLEYWGNNGIQEYIPLKYDGPDVVFKNNAFEDFSPMMPMKEHQIRIYGDDEGYLRVTAEEIISHASVITNEDSFDINLVWQRLGNFGEFTIPEGEEIGKSIYMYGNFGTKIELSDDGGESWYLVDEFNFYDAEFADLENKDTLINNYMRSSYTISESTSSGLLILPNTTYLVKVSISSDYRNDSTDGRLNTNNPDTIDFDNILDIIDVSYEEIVLEETVTTGAFKVDSLIVDKETEVIVKEDGTVAIVKKSADIEITDEDIPTEQQQMDNQVVEAVNKQNDTLSNSAIQGSSIDNQTESLITPIQPIGGN
ncbi:DUF5011 domain-containing protein [Mycoplasmatota bacterium zrk1]